MYRKALRVIALASAIVVALCSVSFAQENGGGGGHTFEGDEQFEKLIWSGVTTEDPLHDPMSYGYVARAWNYFDAAALMIGADPDAADLVARGKLSSETGGGRFWRLAQKVYQSGTNIPDWLPNPWLLSSFYQAYGSDYAQYIFLANEITPEELQGAYNDWTVVVNGGSLGGGPSGTDGPIPLQFEFNRAWGNVWPMGYGGDNGKLHYPAIAYNVTCVMSQAANDALNAKARQYEYFYATCYVPNVYAPPTTQPIGLNFLFFNDTDALKVNQHGTAGPYDGEIWTTYSVKTNTGIGTGAVAYPSSTRQFGTVGTTITLTSNNFNWESKGPNNGIFNGTTNVFIYDHKAGGVGGDSGDGTNGGGGGGDDNPTPWPETPEPDPNPDPPIVPDVPVNPIVEGDTYISNDYNTTNYTENTYTDNNYTYVTNNYTYNNFNDVLEGIDRILAAMDAHCVHLQNAIASAANNIASRVVASVNNLSGNLVGAINTLSGNVVGAVNTLSGNVVGAVNNLGDNVLSALHSEFTNLKTYLRSLFQWLADQFAFTFGRQDIFDDSSILTWLKRIYQRLLNIGTQTPTPNPVDDGDSFWDWVIQQIMQWLRELTGDKLSTVADLLEDLTECFPFSIPWDIALMLGLLVADPVTPVFDLPVPVPSSVSAGSYVSVHVDCSQWDGVAVVIRALMLLLFSVMLAHTAKDWFSDIRIGD